MKSIKYISLMFLLLTGLVSVDAQVMYKTSQQAAVSQSPLGSSFGSGNGSSNSSSNSWSNSWGSRTNMPYMPNSSVSTDSRLRFSGSRYSAQMSEIGASEPRNKYRKAMDDDPFGGGTIDDTPNPLEPGTPIGDALWLLLLLAAGWVGLKKAKKVRR